jgi:hypothetical protein
LEIECLKRKYEYEAPVVLKPWWYKKFKKEKTEHGKIVTVTKTLENTILITHSMLTL